ncbi:DUF2057 family protein [Pantoea stewartii]|uniref:YccT family protein n=1 Tax=Pantoea stewartii TaxID=66269 RepID=UPI0019804ADC|nr:DUF2057 family protein [Pantoea stewartii]
MKLSMAVTGFIALLVSASCFAITLKLDPQITLMVLDGRKISGSLLKGADSLELERGQHQFLFRVEQPADPRKTALPGYQSVPMIVAFTAAAKTITIRLPPLTSARERHNFDRTLAFRLVDEKGKEIFSVRDRLPTSPGVDIEKAMVKYNRMGLAASVPQFANLTAPSPSAQLTADLAWSVQSTTPSIQRWFERFDEATRQQFINLVKMLRAS